MNLFADTKRKILSVAEANIYKEISSDFILEDGEKLVRQILKEKSKEFSDENREIEILEANSFNMVDYSSFGKI